MLLDTNALFLPFRAGLELVAEVERLLPGAELVVPETALSELDRLVTRGLPQAGAVRRFATGFRTVPARGRGDTAVLHAAAELGAWVVTADRLLSERLRRAGVGVLAPRDRARLTLTRGEPVEALLPAARRRARGKG